MADMKKIAVLISGGGTNLQALIDKIHGKHGEIAVVLSNKKDAYGLTRAKEAGIEAKYIPPVDENGERLDDEAYAKILEDEIKKRDCALVVLAGYMKIVPKSFVDAFPDRIINIHPALIPSFCGEGYYGLRVHQAVLDYGAKLSGATVHFVNEEADGGPVIAQRAVEVLPDDTPQTLQRRILENVEHVLLPEVVQAILEGRVRREGRTVFVDPSQDGWI